MVKFSATSNRPRPTGPVTTGPGYGPTRTHEGGHGYSLDAESELFLMAATSMSGEGTFYESGAQRNERFAGLVHRVTASNPDFIVRFAPYLRNELKIRSASIVLAAEYVAAGGEGGRQVVDSVLQRGDEPAEMIHLAVSRRTLQSSHWLS